jgi:hypothetical protein
MNKIYLAAITGAALMAVAGIANAQGTGTTSGSTGTAANQCWDVSSNMVPTDKPIGDWKPRMAVQMQDAAILLAVLLAFRQMLQLPRANRLLLSAEAPQDAAAPVQTQLGRCAEDQIRNYGRSI